jgi:hypothetical protein
MTTKQGIAVDITAPGLEAVLQKWIFSIPDRVSSMGLKVLSICHYPMTKNGSRRWPMREDLQQCGRSEAELRLSWDPSLRSQITATRSISKSAHPHTAFADDHAAG